MQVRTQSVNDVSSWIRDPYQLVQGVYRGVPDCENAAAPDAGEGGSTELATPDEADLTLFFRFAEAFQGISLSPTVLNLLDRHPGPCMYRLSNAATITPSAPSLSTKSRITFCRS